MQSLISIVKLELKRSAVADNESGKSKHSEFRMFISKAKDPIVSGIEDKIATWTFLRKGAASPKRETTERNALLFYSLHPNLLILIVSMVGALSVKVRNGQQQSGFMWIPLTKLWVPKEIAPMLMRIVRDGLLWGNAPRIQSICWEVQALQDVAGRAAKCVNSLCFSLPLNLLRDSSSTLI
ncbi:uncharacterized protein LOC132051826 [Lycium ferocissimum]|uniref:uncharacterized protein LOC132051826 n=1 Tax=Lycium ferocissimum TaxID=112874 RepID=UPI002814E053|nr:uncharacterized protein LOC132051826 [Lycium ferocissimum]XP_059299042.1 uncharacterized protein LOC132051826 [Lycium ferocissimum]XP_059299043.1 uncharacterized protein LOC132051826 [Lycium ferocissimum]XP_059299044.1 uncharacterized protein LOC132051826 [Lycium ferocissimum]XP_059299045.1 uncharacterized protein LOC132051826 [Lycium ferocissimum]XP_059299046.1 uncharacterized protein LOC132051826 [Lycium ferocissimum]XP_059299047.1 uncharacterized protein LOC132051826 [Lycium ferocissimu